MNNTKVCTMCKTEKPFDDFPKDPRMADGSRNQCKRCRDFRKREQIANSPELQRKAKERSARYYREHQEETIARVRAYAQENRDKVLEKSRKYWHTRVDKEAYNEARQARRVERYWSDLEFREKRLRESRHSTKTRKARLRGAEGSYSLREWEELCEKYNYTCLRCGLSGSDVYLTVDHVIPVSKGGTNTIENIQPLCGSCNSKKNNKHIDYRPK